MTIAIIQTGTTTAMVQTGTTTAIVISGEAGGGAGVGTSKQVGVSLVNKQITETTQKRKLLETELVLQGKLFHTFETALRVKTQLKSLNLSELTIFGELYKTIQTPLHVRLDHLAPLGARMTLSAPIKVSQKTKLNISGEVDLTYLDLLLTLANLGD